MNERWIMQSSTPVCPQCHSLLHPLPNQSGLFCKNLECEKGLETLVELMNRIQEKKSPTVTLTR